jgi:hypothetical protein
MFEMRIAITATQLTARRAGTCRKYAIAAPMSNAAPAMNPQSPAWTGTGKIRKGAKSAMNMRCTVCSTTSSLFAHTPSEAGLRRSRKPSCENFAASPSRSVGILATTVRDYEDFASFR